MPGRIAACLLALPALIGLCLAGERPVVLATTTSTYDSGLLDYLLPHFERQAGIAVKVIAVGTGQALALGRRGDTDLLLVHSPEQEREFMRAGHGAGRWPLMYNHLVIVGPAADPAEVRSAPSAVAAFQRIARAQAPFVSRGDESGTHHREREVWQAAGIAPQGKWYLAAGSGMASTLRLADEKQAYALSDIATYLAHRGRLRLALLFEREHELLNPYALIAVNPQRHPAVSHDGAMLLVRYLLADRARERIASFGVERFGRPVFQLHHRAGKG